MVVGVGYLFLRFVGDRKSHSNLLEVETKGHNNCIYEFLVLIQVGKCGVNHFSDPYLA
jgi:hypothetical protein